MAPTPDDTIAALHAGGKPDCEDIRAVYGEVCKALHQIDDFRAKLLALLPLSSGAGIFLLLETSGGNQEHLRPIGVFGALFSFGLGVYEARQTVVCGHLVEVGAELEGRMNFKGGPFLDRPAPSGLPHGRRFKRFWLSTPMASGLVYVFVIVAWIYLAAFA